MPSRRDLRNVGLGIGAGLLLSSTWPALRQAVRPAAKQMIRGIYTMSEKMKTLSAELQEEVEDIAAEVHHERSASENGNDSPLKAAFLGGDGKLREEER